MLEQLKSEVAALWRELKPRLMRLWVRALVMLRAAWGLARPALIMALQIAAALVVLFEEWGYRPLVEALGRLSRFRAWALLELWIAGLPPYGALAVFALPTTILLPLKFVALWLLANGMYGSATLLFIGAKIASTAFIARIFMLTKPALMQIGWFARAYNFLMPWKEAIFAQIRVSRVWRYGRMVKSRIKLETKKMWTRWLPVIERWPAEWAPRARAAWIGAQSKGRDAWVGVKPQIMSAVERGRSSARRAWARVRGA